MGKKCRITSIRPVGPGHTWPAATLRVGEAFLEIHFDIEDHRIVIKQIAADRITAELVREANLGTFENELTELLRERPERLNWAALIYLSSELGTLVLPLSDEDKRVYRAIAESARIEGAALKQPKRGRGALSEEHYRDVAIAYLNLYNADRYRVSKRLTEMYREQGHLGLSENTVKTWVHRARDLKWLSEGTQGRAGAKAGPRLKEWLKEQGDES